MYYLLDITPETEFIDHAMIWLGNLDWSSKLRVSKVHNTQSTKMTVKA